MDARAYHGAESLLAPSLELALRGCLEQLRALRTAQASPTAASAAASSVAAEERALKLSLSAIVNQLQAIRHAGKVRCSALLLNALPQLLHFLSTRDVLLTGAASASLYAASAVAPASAEEGSGRRRLRLVPHLDAAPDDAEAAACLLDSLALGAVRSVSLPAAAAATLLTSRRVGQLAALESLVLPEGCCGLLAVLSRLPALRRLSLHAAAEDGFDAAAAEALAAALSALREPLSVLRLEALAPELSARVLHAVLHHGGHTERLVLARCALPDEAVAALCGTLAGCATAGPQAVLLDVDFEECELSDLAEQRLLAVLERHDGPCRLALEGGTTRASSLGDVQRWAAAAGDEPGCEILCASASDSDAERAAADCARPAEPAVGSPRSDNDKDAVIVQLRAALAARDARLRELEERLARAEAALAAAAMAMPPANCASARSAPSCRRSAAPSGAQSQ